MKNFILRSIGILKPIFKNLKEKLFKNFFTINFLKKGFLAYSILSNCFYWYYGLLQVSRLSFKTFNWVKAIATVNFINVTLIQLLFYYF